MSIQFVAALATRLPKVGQLARIAFVGQEAAAPCRLRPIAETELLCQLDLRLPATATEIVKLVAVYPALALRQGRFQTFGAQGAQQAIIRAGFAGNDGHGGGNVATWDAAPPPRR
jgi:hypothetical protein